MSLKTYSLLEILTVCQISHPIKRKADSSELGFGLCCLLFWGFFGLFGGVFLTEFALPEPLDRYNPLDLQNHQL